MCRTKTSSPYKVTVPLVFVSQEAWVGQPWLDTGLALWLEEGMWFSRRYFLFLPAESLETTRRTTAAYSDAAGFSKCLLGALEDTDGTALLHPAAVSFWLVHLNRPGLTSWCATLWAEGRRAGFPRPLGGQGAADVYVHTAARVCENLQESIRRRCRLLQ